MTDIDKINQYLNDKYLARRYLSNTDYVIIKISEALAEGDTDEAERIRTEHAEDLAKRKMLRRLINEIEAKWESR